MGSYGCTTRRRTWLSLDRTDQTGGHISQACIEDTIDVLGCQIDPDQRLVVGVEGDFSNGLAVHRFASIGRVSSRPKDDGRVLSGRHIFNLGKDA